MRSKQHILIAADLISLTVSFSVAFLIRRSSILSSLAGSITYNVQSYVISFVIACILLLLIFSSFKLYQIRALELSARIFTVLKALAIWAFITATLTYVVKFDFSRSVFFMTIVLTVILVTTSRYILFKHRQKKMRNETIDVTIIGTGHRATDIEEHIKSVLPNSTCKKLAYANPATHSYLVKMPATDLILADEHLTRDEVLSILADQSLNHHSFRVVLDVFRLVTGEVRFNDIDEIPSITPHRRPRIAYRLVKRGIDLVSSMVGLILASPVWIVIAVMINLDSPGPVLIRQQRAGWHGRPFTLLKFRTMHVDVLLYEKAPRDENDRRITRVGRILRRLSLDEVPQLWNIFRGDMSLVGPRPEMEFIVNTYAPWQRLRLAAKPGLTGLWQILGRKDIPLHENLEYDFYYVSNRSLLLDSTIILKTVPAVLFGRGAY